MVKVGAVPLAHFTPDHQVIFVPGFVSSKIKLVTYPELEIPDTVKVVAPDIVLENILPVVQAISLKTGKENYKVGENIEITVILENVSLRNLWVKGLDKDTLYFLYDGAKWGTVLVGKKGERRRERFVLKPGEKIHRKFVGSGSSKPREIEIYCSYIVTFQGVKPSQVLTVKVIE